jgi:hypothetical protein
MRTKHLTLAALLLAGCGSDDRGGPLKPAGPAFAGANAQAGPVICKPSPGNFDVPGNGCDDDADGKPDVLAACDESLPVTGDAEAFVRSIGLCKAATANSWGLVSAKYTRGWNIAEAPPDGQHGILRKFGTNVGPREGNSFGVLSTGFAREYNDENGVGSPSQQQGAFQQGVEMSGPGAVPPGYPRPASGCEIAKDVHDVITVELQIKAPDNAKGISFDFDFYSGEWPEFVCTKYNDGFAAFLIAQGFNGGALDNISFDANHNPVSVNNGFFDRCTPNTETGCAGGQIKTASCPGGEAELAGTGFAMRGPFCGNKESSGGGSTGWLQSQAPIAPGETFKLYFFLWDTGDGRYDSSVLLDHFQWLEGATTTRTERPK